MQNIAALDPNFVKWVFTLAATFVLFLVFAASALAFILMVFGALKPDGAAKKFLYAVFSVSTVSLFVGLATGFLNPASTLNKIRTDASREAALESAQTAPLPTISPMATNTPTPLSTPSASPSVAPTLANARIVIFTQVGSEADLGKGRALNNSLPKAKYATPAVDNVDMKISENQIRYCSADNRNDADELAKLLKSYSFNPFTVVQIKNCDQKKNLNILEVWIQSRS